ncbi:MAG: hypothetical protein KGQ89_09755 [Verrucomicrobia bacterium]|nr:hypothetical protein [Verrucomicrobiota bacterium]
MLLVNFAISSRERKPLVVENATDPKVMLLPNLIAVIRKAACLEWRIVYSAPDNGRVF